MQTLNVAGVIDMKVFHREFTLDKSHNLDDVPPTRAIFGIFAIVEDQPMNCRVIGKSDDLNKTVRELFEAPTSPGLKKFMQGPWYKVLRFQEIHQHTPEEQKALVREWESKYEPKVDDEGEYPGYYDY